MESGFALFAEVSLLKKSGFLTHLMLLMIHQSDVSLGTNMTSSGKACQKKEKRGGEDLHCGGVDNDLCAKERAFLS